MAIVVHMYAYIVKRTWLSKSFDSVNDVHTVALSRDNEVQLVKRLGQYDDGVAPSRQW